MFWRPHGQKFSVSYRGVSTSYKIFLLLGFLFVVLVFFYYTQNVVDRLKENSAAVVSTYARLWQLVASGSTSGEEIGILFEEVIQNSNFPIVITDPEGNPLAWRQIRGVPEDDTTAAGLEILKNNVAKMDRSNQPISIYYEQNGNRQLLNILHYDDPYWVKRLHFIPAIEVGITGLFVILGFLGFLNIKRSEQQSIWVGMAKETAHQLGTPISSLLGWLENLKDRETKSKTTGQSQISAEMEKDIRRLEKIAARFSQIGSPPELSEVNFNQLASEVVQYYRQRLPYGGDGVKIEENYSDSGSISGNQELLSWALENIIKNAIESVDPKNGKIQISTTPDLQRGKLVVSVTDNGRGVPVKDRKRIFSPGFTTKKRGWGLGLSLAKRIIEHYHRGKISLAESIAGVRTEFRFQLPLQHKGRA
ncbi:MAG: HAMP domain-containing histidine kinase [candidate division Zixibacteria bacterium]|nr:HAMP domain-containing histidine kinase [candidate division Zixibacteria bacterium]